MSTDAEGSEVSRSSDPVAESFPVLPRTVTDDGKRTIRLRAGAESSAERESSIVDRESSTAIAEHESSDPTARATSGRR